MKLEPYWTKNGWYMVNACNRNFHIGCTSQNETHALVWPTLRSYPTLTLTGGKEAVEAFWAEPGRLEAALMKSRLQGSI